MNSASRSARRPTPAPVLDLDPAISCIVVIRPCRVSRLSATKTRAGRKWLQYSVRGVEEAGLLGLELGLRDRAAGLQRGEPLERGHPVGLPPGLRSSGFCRSARAFREDSAGSRDNRRMRILVVEDEVRLARACAHGLEAEGFAVDVAHDGTDGLWLARENIVRRDRARHHAARDERVPGLRDPARRAGLDADPDAHRQGRRVGPGRGPRHRRGRLPHQAVLVRGPGRPAARAGTSRRAERPAVLEAGDLRLDPAARRVWRGEEEHRR